MQSNPYEQILETVPVNFLDHEAGQFLLCGEEQVAKGSKQQTFLT